MNKQILRLAIPNVISNLSVPLLGVVDTAVVGRLEHIYYLGAIAVGSIIFDFIFWGFGFLRMGTTGLVAQAFGAGNERGIRITLIRVLTVAFSSGIIIILLQIPIIELSLYLINATPEVEEFTRLYYHIRIFAAPATLLLFAFNGWFIGMQNSTYPMMIVIFLNILNIILNLTFVFQFNMTVDGVATGSLISSYCAAALAYFLYRKKYGKAKIEWAFSDLLVPEEVKKFFSVNRDIVIRTLCLIFSYAFFTAKSAEMGNTILAANTILLQMWYISSYGTDGFAYAAESLVGRFKGAGDYKQLKQAVISNMWWGLGLGAMMTVVYAIYHQEIISLFTDKPEVIETAMVVVIWLILAPIINSVCFIWDGVYIGATATSAMRNSMLIATLFFFVPVYFISEPYAGIHALWMAMTAFMVARGIVLTLYAPSQILKRTCS